MKPVMAYWREKGMRCIVYLDDILFLHGSREQLQECAVQLTAFLEDLGFTINREKSLLHPCQQIQFLGFCVDSNLMTLSLPYQKKADITHQIECILQVGTVALDIH